MLRGKGNASFHNASAYEELRPSIHALVLLLHDDEEKTRANAAGALGNMVQSLTFSHLTLSCCKQRHN